MASSFEALSDLDTAMLSSSSQSTPSSLFISDSINTPKGNSPKGAPSSTSSSLPSFTISSAPTLSTTESSPSYPSNSSTDGMGFETGGFIFVILVMALMVALIYFGKTILNRRKLRLLATKTAVTDYESGPPTYYQHVQDLQVIVDPAPHPMEAITQRTTATTTASASSSSTAATTSTPVVPRLPRSSSLTSRTPAALASSRAAAVVAAAAAEESSPSTSITNPPAAAVRGDRYYIVTPRTHSRSRSGVTARRIHYHVQQPRRPVSSSSLESSPGWGGRSRLNQMLTAEEPLPPAYEDLSPRTTVVVL